MHSAKKYAACFSRLAILSLLIFLTCTVHAQSSDTTAWEDVQLAEEAAALPDAAVFEPVSPSDQGPAQARHVDGKKAASLKEDENFWYADEAPRRTPPTPVRQRESSPSIFTGTWFRNLVWFTIVGGFIVILFLFLRSGGVRLFEKKPKAVSHNLEEEGSEDLFEGDYQTRAHQAAAAGEYRHATRFLYLGVLKELALKNIIRYGQERTNSDYLNQLWSTDYYEDFFGLTRSFEYTWYGKFKLSEDAFRLLERNFTSFTKRLHA